MGRGVNGLHNLHVDSAVLARFPILVLVYKRFMKTSACPVSRRLTKPALGFYTKSSSTSLSKEANPKNGKKIINGKELSAIWHYFITNIL